MQKAPAALYGILSQALCRWEDELVATCVEVGFVQAPPI
jgi:hypothetical protein